MTKSFNANALMALCLLLVSWLAWGGLPAPQEGMPSYYADSLQGNRTASGAKYDKNALTAAHQTLRFGTRVRVTNVANGQAVEVTINDRGPHTKRRIIDLSRAAASKLGILDAGVAKVRVEVLEVPD